MAGGRGCPSVLLAKAMCSSALIPYSRDTVQATWGAAVQRSSKVHPKRHGPRGEQGALPPLQGGVTRSPRAHSSGGRAAQSSQPLHLAAHSTLCPPSHGRLQEDEQPSEGAGRTAPCRRLPPGEGNLAASCRAQLGSQGTSWCLLRTRPSTPDSSRAQTWPALQGRQAGRADGLGHSAWGAGEAGELRPGVRVGGSGLGRTDRGIGQAGERVAAGDLGGVF